MALKENVKDDIRHYIAAHPSPGRTWCIGSAEYSPERWEGMKRLDRATDTFIYRLVHNQQVAAEIVTELSVELGIKAGTTEGSPEYNWVYAYAIDPQASD